MNRLSIPLVRLLLPNRNFLFCFGSSVRTEECAHGPPERKSHPNMTLHIIRLPLSEPVPLLNLNMGSRNPSQCYSGRHNWCTVSSIEGIWI